MHSLAAPLRCTCLGRPIGAQGLCLTEFCLQESRLAFLNNNLLEYGKIPVAGGPNAAQGAQKGSSLGWQLLKINERE
jgi:hypothetical protein